MAKHDQCTEAIWDGLERLLDRYDELRRFIDIAKRVEGDPNIRWRKATYEARASLIVCCMAELEALTKLVITEVHGSLNGLQLSTQDYSSTIVALLGHGQFESLRTLADHEKLWTRRIEVLNLHFASDVIDFPLPRKGPQPPLDGSTLRPPHFDRVWKIYGLPGIPFPKILWSLSLANMADLRNDIAHANAEFDSIFKARGRRVEDFLAHLENIEEFAVHFVETWDVYLDAESYLR